MINETLQFMAKNALEHFLTQRASEVRVQLIPDTAQSTLRLKVDKTPSSIKMKSLGAQFSKQNIENLLDTPLDFTVSLSPTFGSEEYKEMISSNGDFKVKIQPYSEFAEQFLKAFAKNTPEIKINSTSIPEFENPRM